MNDEKSTMIQKKMVGEKRFVFGLGIFGIVMGVLMYLIVDLKDTNLDPPLVTSHPASPSPPTSGSNEGKGQDYIILKTYKHSSDAFTQGLTWYSNDILLESV